MSEEIVCTSCGYVGESKTITKGSMGVEIILWLCLLKPRSHLLCMAPVVSS